MAAPSAEAPCGLCGAAAAPYTCPRCNRRLCSLGCYRGHGGCAEAFYREQVLQALGAERGPPAARDRLASAFRRLQLLGEGEAEAEAEAPAGPAGRGLWQRLSAAERAEFQRLLHSGEVAELLPPWRPWWWRRRQRRRLVEELEPHGSGGGEEEAGEEADEEAAAPPPAPGSPLSLRSLRAPPPSPLVAFQLPNVLFGYAFALALHAGDETLLPELPAAALAASAALRGRPRFASAAQALHAARRDVAAAGYPRCPLGDAGTVLAVAELLEGGAAEDDTDDATGRCHDVTRALAHLEQLLRRGGRALPPTERGPFAGARRKLRYLRGWSWEAAAAPAMAALAEEARRVHRELVAAGGDIVGSDIIAPSDNIAAGDIVAAEEAEAPPWLQLVKARGNEGRRKRLIQELGAGGGGSLGEGVNEVGNERPGEVLVKELD